ncbi:CoA-acylating methylmalonate-semialdehyde dehydrogenase [Sorangium sp. So ce295]|jgi:malonate-semialdehyde dehydrogenase (acetylating)/methylmalonate-semialdehyde dehydrogenase|uniref:CoA-acylating methylmalonate-semialdehyde dehydrogenase n=1 Tax=unclassified Sorangium TaxID=2621164 RepID=UPI003F60584F
MIKKLQNHVGGKMTDSSTQRWGDVFNPALGAVTSKVPMSTAAEVSSAVAVAKQAFESWSATPPVRRARVMFELKGLIDQHMDELAGLVTAEHGKVLEDARGSVTRGMEVVEFAAGIPQLLKGEYSEGVARGVDSWSFRQPLGVCAGIGPFNFPAMIPLWMAPIAIACGNTFVMKPSEKVPSLSLRLAELWAQAGLPPGVFNVVSGDKEVVDAFIEHPDVAAISLVGSTPVAENVYQRATRAGKRVQALGGAKNHMIVMPDADLSHTVDALMGAAYGSAGERCMAISVAVAVGPETGDRLVEALIPRVKALKIGPGNQPGMDMGPLVTKQHLEKVSGYVDLGVKEGAKLLVDGRGLKIPGSENGFFLGGCLFDHVTSAMTIYQEEIFGPVLAVVRVPTLDAAIQLVNAHRYGNGGAIFTSSGDAADEFTKRIQIGMVGVNVPIPVPMAFHSFGGWKASLFGDHYMHGPEGVRFFTRMKTVTSRWPRGASVGASFAMPTVK